MMAHAPLAIIIRFSLANNSPRTKRTLRPLRKSSARPSIRWSDCAAARNSVSREIVAHGSPPIASKNKRTHHRVGKRNCHATMQHAIGVAVSWFRPKASDSLSRVDIHSTKQWAYMTSETRRSYTGKRFKTCRDTNSHGHQIC